MTKAELRKYAFEQRRQLSPLQLEWYSQQICNLFFSQFTMQAVKYLHMYIPVQKFQEVDTFLIIRTLQTNFPSVRITVPKVNNRDLSMESYLYDEHLVLKKNSWGITEPESGTIINPQQMDMMLLPLLGFDERGYRAGYGKGFYDRYLQRCRKDITLIGICCLEPVSRIDDTNNFDIPMHFCITPQKVWQFGAS